MAGGSQLWGKRWASGWKYSPLVPGHFCQVPNALWPGKLWSPAPQLHPGVSPFLGRLSQVSSGPGSCMDHTVQFVIFAKSASVLCLSLPVYKREGAMKSFGRSVMSVACLKREYHRCKVMCVSKREKERWCWKKERRKEIL